MEQAFKGCYQFGPFLLDTQERVLLRDGQPVPMTPRAYQVLLTLVERRGRVVEKEFFMREVWDGTLRDESNLPQQVSVLRRLLGEKDGQKYIETVATRGYRFVATVRAETSPQTLQGISEPVLTTENFDNDAAVLLQKRTDITVMRHVAATSDAQNDQAVTVHRALQVLPRRSLWTRVFVVLTIGLVTAALAYWVGFRRAAQPASSITQVAPAVRTIAVLPFKVRGQPTGDDYLEMGLADAVASRLGAVSSLVVSPMSAVERVYQEGRAKDSLAAGRELSADAVLESSVQRAGDDLRVTARLLRVSDGVQLWSNAYDEKFAQVFRIQDSISNELVAALSVKLVGKESERLARHTTQNPDAYRFYLLGRYFWRIDQIKSREYLKQAVAADPGYAVAHAALADAYIFNPDDGIEAERHALRALELDEELAEAHATLGFVQMFHRWNWSEAGQRLRRAVELNPSYATARQWYALYLVSEGRMTEAVAQMEEAVKLDQLSAQFHADLGQVYFFAGQDAKAIAACHRALELNPRHDWARLYLFYIHAKAGRQEEAATAYLEFLTAVMEPGVSQHYDNAVQGRRRGGLRGLLEVDINFFENSAKSPGSFNRLAEDYAILGDRERALLWLERAVNERNFFMVFIKTNPLFSELRDDPRYNALVRRVGLSQPDSVSDRGN